MLLCCALLSCGFLHGSKYYTSESEYWMNAYVALDDFGEKLAKQFHLKFLNSGRKVLAGAQSPDGEWALNFISNQSMTIEQARPMVKEMAFAVLYNMYHDPIFEVVVRTKRLPFQSTTLNDRMIGFKISFWDSNNDRPLYPALAQIRLADEHLYYHYADPKTQALQDPIVVPLSEVLDPKSYQK